MHTEFIAYATSSDNAIGADAGITVYRKVMEDGILREESEIATWTADGAEIDDELGALDFDAAEAQLERMGYQLAGAWTESGGQWAVEVEKIG